MPQDLEPTLNKARHIKYFLRCLKTLLPNAYTTYDSQRMTFAFFTLSALDLLDALDDHTTIKERQEYVNWIYRCQHADGGFKGFTGADGGADSNKEGGASWDPANLAATFFALAALIILEDSMERVRMLQTLEWVNRLQRSDGSFGEAIGKDGVVDGGQDVRYCYLAAGVRWILRRGETFNVEDINTNGLVDFVERSITFEGGIAKAPSHEAHAGWTYCGIGALKMLGRITTTGAGMLGVSPSPYVSDAESRDLIRWLVLRQTTYLREIEEDEETSFTTSSDSMPSFQKTAAYPLASLQTGHTKATIDRLPTEDLHSAGFNGRCNKVADTCYAFWVGASLAMLQKVHLQDFNAAQSYLLGKTQHMIGGFGKMCGDPPDILHSCLGLAALATIKYPELRSIDPMLCISIRAKQRFEARSSTGGLHAKLDAG